MVTLQHGHEWINPILDEQERGQAQACHHKSMTSGICHENASLFPYLERYLVRRTMLEIECAWEKQCSSVCVYAGAGNRPHSAAWVYREYLRCPGCSDLATSGGIGGPVRQRQLLFSSVAKHHIMHNP